MTSKCWYASFAILSLVTNAVYNRTWNSLNYALLTHPEIVGTKQKVTAQQEGIKTTETDTGIQMGTASNSFSVVAKIKRKDTMDLVIIEINVGKGTAMQCVSTLMEIVLHNGGLENWGEQFATGHQSV